ncbi:hypothetical protein KP509_26G050800 [Ceratopteris richardii]|uniref:RRM domain-containing protein n=1 Tax=Ceratopteris richardii TaxID=49495 RepID=A0A8T2RKZ4_CERRI|nr:hypothetical protein KP509_26G050800 [Ceratopteris richardii]
MTSDSNAGAHYSQGRWCAHSASIGEALQALSSMVGLPDGVASNGYVPEKRIKDVEKQGVAKESPTAELNENQDPQESPTDRITNLIIRKVRGKVNVNDRGKENASSGPSNAKGRKRTSENNVSEKWGQVLASMRNMAIKRKQGFLSNNLSDTTSVKLGENENLDDFADLDLAPGQLSMVLRDEGNLPSTDEASMNSLLHSKQRESARSQVPDQQLGPKESGFNPSFQKASENVTTSSKAQVPRNRMPPKQNVDVSSDSKAKENGLRGSIQASCKKPKPIVFDFGKFKSSSDVELNSRKQIDSGQYQDKSSPNGKDLQEEELSTGLDNHALSSHFGHIVCVKNLSNQINLGLIKESLSIHGEIESSFRQANPDGSYCAFIEFKTAEAMDEALACRWMHFDGKVYAIVRTDSPITTEVRIMRVSQPTTHIEFRNACTRFGNVEFIRRRGDGIYDVSYSPSELPNMSKIVDSLNEVTLHRSRWLAVPAPTLPESMRKSILSKSEGQAWHAEQLRQVISGIEAGLQKVSISFEDLKALVAMEDEMKN